MIENIISIATSQLGYTEGYNDDTEYGRWYGLNYQPWCAMFVSWCAFMANIPTTIIPRHAVCLTGANWFKSAGRWHTTPQRGDIVFFYESGSINHEGIVTGVTSSQITTIEGNTTNMVASRPYSRSNGTIAGYGRPNYDVIVTQNDFNAMAEGYFSALSARTDVSSWAINAWNNCVSRGLLDGTSPKGILPREQFAAVLNKIV